MTHDAMHGLFDVESHNPSFRAIKDAQTFAGDLLDFCVPINTHFPPAEMKALLVEELDEVLRVYPDYTEAHQRHLAELTGLPPEMLVPANGSTEVITALCQDAAGPMVTSVPTFGRWTDLPAESGVPLYTLERRREQQFRLEPADVVSRVLDVGAATLVLSNPNNPTGAAMPLADVALIAAALADLDAVIVDESFIDFSDVGSAASLIDDLPNIVVVKSMGKPVGWHGMRLGYAVAQPQRAESLRRRLPYWNINGIAAFVLRTLPHFRAAYRDSFAAMHEDRDYMAARLRSVDGLTVYPSQANFLFVELPPAVSGRMLRDRLLAHHGVIVRETSNKLGSTEQYLRLAVMPGPAVDTLERALRTELAAPPVRAWPT